MYLILGLQSLKDLGPASRPAGSEDGLGWGQVGIAEESPQAQAWD